MTTILVVDDEEAIARVLSQALQSRGYSTMVARDGKEGLRRFCETPPDLVITDILMPEAEGLETIRAMRRVNPAIPIIAMSGGLPAADVSVLSIAEKFGADAIMAKPFRTSDLIRNVDRLLKGEG